MQAHSDVLAAILQKARGRQYGPWRADRASEVVPSAGRLYGEVREPGLVGPRHPERSLATGAM